MYTFYSWNVNGIRAAQRKGFLEWLDATQPDVLGVQETKAHPEQLDEALLAPDGYETVWASAEKRGYSGVALFSKRPPVALQVGLGIEEFDREGRTIIADYGEFVFLTAYFPNGGRDHLRVPFKMRYKGAFLGHCNQLRAAGRSVIFCGDINTAHRPIDLARPRQNRNRTGFLAEERAWIDDIVAQGYVDTFRHCYPDRADAYSWWTYIGGARARNVGWRLDYLFVTSDLVPRIVDAAIHTDVIGSDHCPVSLTLAAS